MPYRRPRRRRIVYVRRVGRSFRYAGAGVAYLFRTQRNAQVEGGIALLAIFAAFVLRLPIGQWALLVFTVAAVLILEALNTAIEAVVDLASPRYNPLAKIAKDVAAGAVLMAATASVFVGLFLFGPPLLRLLFPEP